jgi:SAM-dependent methyltransferase
VTTLSKTKLLLQDRLPGSAYDALQRLAHLRPTHRRWMSERAEMTALRTKMDDEVIALIDDMTVQSGPFEGMELIRENGWGYDLSARLIGCYEKELHPAIEDAISRMPRHIFDVGCADGHYVVGLARRLREAQVFGYDIDSRALALTAAHAKLNGVSDRVSTQGKCTSRDLEGLPENSLIIVDCEGAELHLISPRVVQSNPTSMFIVECHDVIDDRISKIMLRRFEGRSTALVRGTRRIPEDAPQLPWELARDATDEQRVDLATWLIVR